MALNFDPCLDTGELVSFFGAKTLVAADAGWCDFPHRFVDDDYGSCWFGNGIIEVRPHGRRDTLSIPVYVSLRPDGTCEAEPISECPIDQAVLDSAALSIAVFAKTAVDGACDA